MINIMVKIIDKFEQALMKKNSDKKLKFASYMRFGKKEQIK